MNAVLQALLAVPSFQLDLMAPPHVKAALEELVQTPSGDGKHPQNSIFSFAEAISDNKENEFIQNRRSKQVTQLYRFVLFDQNFYFVLFVC